MCEIIKVYQIDDLPIKTTPTPTPKPLNPFPSLLTGTLVDDPVFEALVNCDKEGNVTPALEHNPAA